MKSPSRPNLSRSPSRPRSRDNEKEKAGNEARGWRSFILHWGPVLLVMAVIFGFSTDLGQSKHTSRIIGPLVQFFFPDVSEEATRRIVFAVRKGAHVAEYALLAMLVWRALRRPRRRDPRPWCWPTAWKAVTFASLYAMTDEFHQSLSPNRMGQWQDVVLDTVGAVCGVLCLWAIHRLRRGR